MTDSLKTHCKSLASIESGNSNPHINVAKFCFLHANKDFCSAMYPLSMPSGGTNYMFSIYDKLCNRILYLN